DVLDGKELSVARTAVAHAGSVGFCRLTPTEGERAPPISCPRAVIVTDDGLGFAVPKCDAVDGHSGVPPEEHQARVGTGSYEGRSAHAREVTQMPRHLGRDLLSLIQDREIVSTGAPLA